MDCSVSDGYRETIPMNGLKKAYRVAMIIGIGMIASLFTYAALVEIIKMNYKSFKGFAPFPEIEILRYALFGVVMIEFFFIRWIRSILLSKRVNHVSPEALPSMIQKLITTTVIIFTICESVAIFGLFLFLIGGNSLDFYFFMILSLFFYAVYFPRYNQWEEYISQGIKIGEPLR